MSWICLNLYGISTNLKFEIQIFFVEIDYWWLLLMLRFAVGFGLGSDRIDVGSVLDQIWPLVSELYAGSFGVVRVYPL